MKNNAIHLVTASLLCALTAIVSQLHIPLPPVPISLSLLGVHLCGALLTPAWSAASMGVYLALGALGVPVFSGFSGGFSALLGPLGGFLFGYVACACVESLILRRGPVTAQRLCIAMGVGTLLCYALGTAWFSVSTGARLLHSAAVCILPFIPGDILKILLAARLALRLRRVFGTAWRCRTAR